MPCTHGPNCLRHRIRFSPQHVTQRGNRRQQTFFGEEDYRAYLDLLHEHCSAHGVLIWGWCLMPNHVHLIADTLTLFIATGKLPGLPTAKPPG